jgi:hypothetical protein
VAPLHIVLSAGEHEGVQIAEHPGCYPGAEVLTPAAAQRVHAVDQRHRGRAHMLPPEGFELPPDPRDGALARLHQQLVAAARALGRRVIPALELQEVEALREVANVGFRFRHSQASCPEPCG